MSLDLFGPTTRVLAAALDGAAFRQKVVADNIANVDTPGFRATAVDFESSLRAAIDAGSFDESVQAPGPYRPVSVESVDYTAHATNTPVGPNGNNVDLRKETMAAMQTQFQYQTLTRAVSDQFGIMRTAIGA